MLSIGKNLGMNAKRYGFSFWSDENVLELDSDDSGRIDKEYNIVTRLRNIELYTFRYLNGGFFVL